VPDKDVEAMHLLDSHGYVSQDVFDHILKSIRTEPGRADAAVQACGDLIRYNTLLSVGRAGTGHLGASLSMADLMAELYFRRGRFDPALAGKDRDIFVLSKGHAAPSQYATLAARRFFPNADLDRLRRWNGLPGHSHVKTPGVDGSTGSLAMGLSKAVGYAIAKQRFGLGGRVYTIVGDGEPQEGQAWEAFLSAAGFACPNFYLIIDANKVQTDQFVGDILVYRDLPGTLRALGFATAECDGHDAKSIRTTLENLDLAGDKPKCLIAHTIKGRGVSFMEHTAVLKKPEDRYLWHNKAPNAGQLAQALEEIVGRVKNTLTSLGIEVASPAPENRIPLEPMATGIEGKPLVPAFAQAVKELARGNPNVVVLDADLEEDCGLTPVRQEFPDRFIELGIMEQHMCSAAAAFSALGYLPIINSYAAFLTSRSNEHIYNLATDRRCRFLLAGHLAGVIPATPGMSHQAFRDIGCLRSIPGLQIYQPMSPEDCKSIIERFGRGEVGPMLYLRIVMAPSAVALPAGDARLAPGRSQVIRPGKDAVILTAGPVMAGEAMLAAELLAAEGKQVEVRNHPWVAAFDDQTLRELAARKVPVIIAEDHYRMGGLGEGFFAAVAARGLSLSAAGHVALEDLPDTGFRTEALAGMGIGRDAIAHRLRQVLAGKSPKVRAA
jgi:transketolase